MGQMNSSRRANRARARTAVRVYVRILPVSLLLEAKWDNIHALSKYTGPVEIFGAEQEAVMPIKHAKKLAGSVPSARFHCIPGGHNDWSQGTSVEIRKP